MRIRPCIRSRSCRRRGAVHRAGGRRWPGPSVIARLPPVMATCEARQGGHPARRDGEPRSFNRRPRSGRWRLLAERPGGPVRGPRQTSSFGGAPPFRAAVLLSVSSAQSSTGPRSGAPRSSTVRVVEPCSSRTVISFRPARRTGAGMQRVVCGPRGRVRAGEGQHARAVQGQRPAPPVREEAVDGDLAEQSLAVVHGPTVVDPSLVLHEGGQARPRPGSEEGEGVLVVLAFQDADRPAVDEDLGAVVSYWTLCGATRQVL